MKYIIALLLIGGVVACKKDPATTSTGVTGAITIFNNSDMTMRIKKGGDDGDDSNSQFLALKNGECVALSEAELAVLTVQEQDCWGFCPDDILCSNMKANEAPCEAGDQVVQEAEDGNGYVLVQASEPNQNCLSAHGVDKARDQEKEEEKKE